MEFGNKLYEMRKEKGLSQEELASRLEVTRQTVSKWELGDSTPDLDKLVLLAELFEISLDELVLDKVCVVSCVLTGSAYTDPVGCP
jgi:transcriptional regulator with XRE-family HTH domain